MRMKPLTEATWSLQCTYRRFSLKTGYFVRVISIWKHEWNISMRYSTLTYLKFYDIYTIKHQILNFYFKLLTFKYNYSQKYTPFASIINNNWIMYLLQNILRVINVWLYYYYDLCINYIVNIISCFVNIKILLKLIIRIISNVWSINI